MIEKGSLFQYYMLWNVEKIWGVSYMIPNLSFGILLHHHYQKKNKRLLLICEKMLKIRRVLTKSGDF